MSTLVKNKNKVESVIFLVCIIILVIGYIIYLILKKISIYELELFSSNNSKRGKMMKIFKSDEIYDPDEKTYDCNDPDGDCGYDLD